MKIHYACETCGKKSCRSYAAQRVPSHFFCSVECQRLWQKTREDIVEKNKNPDFRKKVSAGLKLRKQRLGDEYHSAASKKKIGEATLLHWEQYDDDKRRRMIQVLQNNAIQKRTYGPYDNEWHQLSASIRQGQVCHRCGIETHLCVHHIIPTSVNGTREQRNLVTLCSSCHRIVEHESKKVQELTMDWEITQLLIRERLMCIV